MRQTWKIAATALTLVLALTACQTEYVYTPPISPEGQACTGKCSDAQQSCYVPLEAQAQRANAECQRRAQHEYAECMEHAADKSKCYLSYCAFHRNTEPCDAAYRSCYQKCGGTVAVKK